MENLLLLKQVYFTGEVAFVDFVEIGVLCVLWLFKDTSVQL